MNATTLPPTPPHLTSTVDWNLEIPEPRRRLVRIWLWSLAGMTLLTLIVGGITRLTRSGLSIVDWRPIMGVIPPLTDAHWMEAFARYREFPEYQQLRSGMSLEEFRFIFFWEYLHRLVARAIGLVFLVPFLLFWLRGYLARPLMRRVLILLGLGASQGVMGWVMVRSGLVDVPRVSHYRLAAHLSLALVIFGYAVWLARELAVGEERTALPAEARRLIHGGLWWVGGILAVLIVWGAFVAGLKAGFLYNTFPLMAGGLVPPDLLRLDPAIRNFVENPSAVQWTHRLLGTVLLLVAVWFFLRVRRLPADPASRAMNRVLLTLIVGQYALGVSTLLLRVPVTLGVAHQAVAMAIAGVWLWWMHHVRRMESSSPVPER